MPRSGFRVALSHDFLRPDGQATIAGFDLSPLQADSETEFEYLEAVEELRADQLDDYDALILQWPQVTAASLGSSRRLAVVARFGVGYDNVDIGAATRAGVAVVNTPDAVRRPVAVSILTFLLALSGRLMQRDRATRESRWEAVAEDIGVGLVGRTLGSIGLGNIGQELFRLARPFDMDFIAHDPFVEPAVAEELGVRLVGLEDAFREADFLNISVPLTRETRGLVNGERLALMKGTAFLINTARGPVVDQSALTRALQERRIAGAGLDVFEKEPPDPDDPILGLDNVILAPHALCETDQLQGAIGKSVIDTVLSVKRGQPPGNLVNRDVLENERFRAKLENLRNRFGPG